MNNEKNDDIVGTFTGLGLVLGFFGWMFGIISSWLIFLFVLFACIGAGVLLDKKIKHLKVMADRQ